MKPSYFKEVTKDLLKPLRYDEEKHGKCGSLPVFCDGEMCVSLSVNNSVFEKE